MAGQQKKPDPPPPQKHDVIVTKHAVVKTLDPDLQPKAQECLQKSGKITFTFREISVTNLPQTLDDGVLID
jgi:hypothetical protein